jgi:hypothetical protein
MSSLRQIGSAARNITIHSNESNSSLEQFIREEIERKLYHHRYRYSESEFDELCKAEYAGFLAGQKENAEEASTMSKRKGFFKRILWVLK